MRNFSVLLSLHDERRLYVVEASDPGKAVAFAKRVAVAHDTVGSNWEMEVVFHGASYLAMKGASVKVIDLRSSAQEQEPVPHAQRGGGC